MRWREGGWVSEGEMNDVIINRKQGIYGNLETKSDAKINLV
jgi:hypothetical protein